ncbi:fused MFS/spermidine synthase [bacterium]|nr:fused MFS/spermidine synthase [bacterium]
MRQLYRLALGLFFLSGLTGLVYEILWTRRLSLTFGHSLLAVSTVVTAYMGGLAAGSWWGGGWADRRLASGASSRQFLRAYGRLELAIGAWGLLSLPLLGAVEKVYFWLAGQGWQGLGLHLTVFALSLAALLPPTTAMGATLPLLSCLFHQAPDSLGVKLSRLYASNTWGAVVGAGLAGFVWLPGLGLTNSVLLAALLNLTIGAIAVTRGALPVADLVAGPPLLPSPRPGRSWLPWVFALSGFASMFMQLAWTRGLSLFLGSSVYAFSAILLAFLGGIAAGSGVYSAWMRQRQPSLAQLGWLYLGVGVTAALSIPLMSLLPEAFVRSFGWVQHSFPALLTLDVALCGLVLLLPTLMLGLLFPLVTHLYHQQSGTLGGSVGTIYGANTLGCILGSFIGGFFAMPQLGVQVTLQVAASLCLLASFVIGGRALRGVGLLALLGCWCLPPWDTGLASAGVAISVAREGAKTASYYPAPAYYKDGLSCTVALTINGPGDISLRVNGKPDASLTIADRLTQTSLGLIPLLYQPRPERVAVIGLGGGVTVTALAGSPRVAQVDCAELEPAVIECQRFWAPFNQRILENPKVQVRVADGRTFILSSSQPFDAIVSEPSNPWIAGIGNLYTLDFYQACRQRLRPGGCFVQWCNLYALSPEDLDLVVRTFFEAFPHGDLWTTGGDLVLIGSSQPTTCSPQPLQEYARKNPWLPYELSELGFAQPEELVSQYLCSREQALQHLKPGPLNRDDLPRLEYSAPLSLYRPEALQVNLLRCLSWRSQQLPAGWPDDAAHRLAGWIGRLNFSYPDLVRFPASQAPDWPEFFAMMNTATGAQPVPPQALARNWPPRASLELGRRASNPVDVLKWVPSPHPLRAQALYRLGRWSEAAAEYRQLPLSSEVWSSIATCYYFLGNLPEADKAADQALRANPYDTRALYLKADRSLRQQNPEAALQTVKELNHLCPSMINGWHLRIRILLEMRQLDQARQSLRLALRMFPEDGKLLDLQVQLGR